MHLPLESIPFTRLFLAVLLHFVWQAALVVTFIAIVRSLVHPRFFQARYLLSVTGLSLVLIAPVLTAGYYLTHQDAMLALAPATSAFFGSSEVASSPSGFASVLDSQFQLVFGWFDNHRLYWLGAWMVGFVLLTLRLGLSLGHCVRLRRSQQPLPRNMQKLADRLKKRLRLSGAVIVASSREITTAVATGIIRPVVLIPAAWLSQLPVSAVEAVLAHELAHIKRWDLWVNLLQRFVETVFFFHPLVWWLSRTITVEREVCCDQLAVKVTGQPMRYVETLAHVAGTSNMDDFEFQFGTAFFGGKKMNLLRRAKMILEPTAVDVQSPFRTLTLIVCVGLLLSYGSYAYCAAAAATQDPEREQIELTLHEIDQSDHQNQEIDVVLINDDEPKKVNVERLHNHLIELLHGDDAGNVDQKQLARQLRQLADRLDRADTARRNPSAIRRVWVVEDKASEARNNKFVHEGVDVVKDAESTYSVEVRPDGKTVVRSVENSPKGRQQVRDHDGSVGVRGRIVEFKADDEHEGNVIIIDNDPNDHHQNSFIEKAHVSDDGHPHGEHEVEFHFDHADSTNHDLGQAIRDLKNEVQQLRNELNSMRSGKNPPQKERVRVRLDERKQSGPARYEFKQDSDHPQAKWTFELKPDEVRNEADGQLGVWVVESKDKKDVRAELRKRQVVDGDRIIYRTRRDDDSKSEREFRWVEKQEDGKSSQSDKLQRVRTTEKDLKESGKGGTFYFKKSDDAEKSNELANKSGVSWFFGKATPDSDEAAAKKEKQE